jgi:hypothetical protein
MDDIVKNFNKTIKKLIDILDSEFPNDALVDTINRRYTIAITSDRKMLISEIGPEIYEYREYISNDKWDELLSMNWETITAKRLEDIGEDSAGFMNMIKTIKKIWIKYDESDRKVITTYIKRLLSYHCRYITA